MTAHNWTPDEELPAFLGSEFVPDELPPICCVRLERSSQRDHSSHQPAADSSAGLGELCVPESALWRRKRENQKRDMEALAQGLVTEDELSWFSGGRTKQFKLVDSPY